MLAVQTRTLTPADVSVKNLQNLQLNSDNVCAKAMELTDSWGQAMFIMDKPLVEKIFAALGFSKEVCSEVYDAIRSLSYVRTIDKQAAVTWHAIDAACMTIRGIFDLGNAMKQIDDTNVEEFLVANLAFYEKLMNAMPDYTRNLMFSPEVAAVVIATLGGNVSDHKIYQLAAKYGHQATRDLEGRRGVSTQFIRSLTLTISAYIDAE